MTVKLQYAVQLYIVKCRNTSDNNGCESIATASDYALNPPNILQCTVFFLTYTDRWERDRRFCVYLLMYVPTRHCHYLQTTIFLRGDVWPLCLWMSMCVFVFVYVFVSRSHIWNQFQVWTIELCDVCACTVCHCFLSHCQIPAFPVSSHIILSYQ